QSVLRYKGSDKPLQEIARELHVHALIEGSILRAGDDVRINVQLIEASSEGHLWADIFDRKLEDILTLHSDVARAIAREIKATLTPEEEARLASARRVNPEAYETYIKGMYHLNKFTPEGFEKGLAYLNEAIEKDPSDPFAYAALALGYAMMAHGLLAPPEETYPRAIAAARKALDLDDTVAEAHAALAESKLYYDWDWAGADQAFRRALELNPNLAEAHQHYSWYLHLMGRRDEALTEMRRAHELDPLAPIFTADMGWQYYAAGQYEEAIDQAQKSLELDTNFLWALAVLSAAYADGGMPEKAIAVALTLVEVSPAWKLTLGYVYARAGREDETRKILAGLKEEEKDPWSLAGVYAALGEIDAGIRWLEAGYEGRQSFIPWIKWNPAFEPLRGDPRFQEIVQRFNLPE
ncbi:MAG: hypothetical protein V3U35_04680, partial [Candidatus Neomarinimicrobiota bacterium]